MQYHDNSYLSSERSSVKEDADINPPSVSISTILKAGMLVKPSVQNKVNLTLEQFSVQNREWEIFKADDFVVDTKYFSSGAFRNAFKAKSFKPKQQTWVLKTYKSDAIKVMEDNMKTSVENHARKQVQMHSAAVQIANEFKKHAPGSFGECFKYNRVFYTKYLDKPATIEEFVPGSFSKYVNNNGLCCSPPQGCTSYVKEMYEKAQCLVHFSYLHSDQKFMLLDIQGSFYQLYDPEIATVDMRNTNSDNAEIYFCCGNLSTIAINKFLEEHTCNAYCKSMKLKSVGGSSH